MYGTTGLGYNVNKVDEDEVESWDILFNPNIASKYEDCGISILDAPSEVMEIALKYIGKDPNTEDESDYKEALEMLKKIRPFVRYFDSSQYIDDLASGEICLAMGWSGDVFLAADEAADDIEAWYSIPTEGTVIWFDMMAIPADSKNVSNAHKFINYILRPQVAANITNYVWYSNPNMAANELVDPEIFEDAAIYPDEETLSKLFADTADSPKKSRLSSKYFNKFKSN
jgi:putrescine transport system substrate-binding protein